jgi:catechol 2,3-dioxygenase-like lactoylglutathione lyase family enzyme
VDRRGLTRGSSTVDRVERSPIDAQITFVYVDELDRSAAFYGGVLGLELVRDQGACLIYRVAGDAYLGVCDHRSPEPGGMILTIVTDDVDTWAESVADAGHPVDGPHTNTRFSLYHCFVRDPDGHVVEIQRFDEPL